MTEVDKVVDKLSGKFAMNDCRKLLASVDELWKGVAGEIHSLEDQMTLGCFNRHMNSVKRLLNDAIETSNRLRS